MGMITILEVRATRTWGGHALMHGVLPVVVTICPSIKINKKEYVTIVRAAPIFQLLLVTTMLQNAVRKLTHALLNVLKTVLNVILFVAINSLLVQLIHKLQHARHHFVHQIVQNAIKNTNVILQLNHAIGIQLIHICQIWANVKMGKNQLVPLVRRLVNANLVNVSMIKQACKVVKPLLFAQNMTIVTVTSIAIMQQRYAKRKKTLESLVRQTTNVWKKIVIQIPINVQRLHVQLNVMNVATKMIVNKMEKEQQILVNTRTMTRMRATITIRVSQTGRVDARNAS
jgi:hypothetical protein